MRRALDACVARDDMRVAVVSGRSLADLRRIFDVPGLTLAGNHGLEIGGAGVTPFRHPDLAHFTDRLATLADELEAHIDSGAWVERKGATLTVHVRATPVGRPRPDRRARPSGSSRRRASRRATDCARWRRVRRSAGTRARRRCRSSASGTARRGPSGCASSIAGDDQTDEDAFRVLAGLGVTLRVGGADSVTLAEHRLPNLEAVEALLKWLAERPPARAGAGDPRAGGARLERDRVSSRRWPNRRAQRGAGI